MAQINKPTDYFNTKLYTGDGTSSNAITGVGFQPDWNWIKRRNTADSHRIQDSVRGSTKYLSSNSTDNEVNAGAVSSFDTDGFTLSSSDSKYNASGSTYASWNWYTGATPSSNTDGSITSNVSANTTSGFSIVSYTGTGANATVGHGLGTSDIGAVIVKNRDSGSDNWWVFHKSIGATGGLKLNTTDTTVTASSLWNDTAPTSSVFSIGTGSGLNASGQDLIAYCFAEKKGYSKFGSYTGNGNADGTFVYTGFKPAMVILKATSISGKSWMMFDNKRIGYNQANYTMVANGSNAEDTTAGRYDVLSNGFKLRNSGSAQNGSGSTYIYMAFAENPLVGTNNIPATAR